ncbi:MAG: C4-dicarboxylate ABC transporter, partial [Pseudomonas sp.]|nr:C4-dicarboxylate ABC transporter [Pseudomonas sp.]
AEQRQAWRDAKRPVWEQFLGQFGSDVIKAAQTVNRKHRE